MALSYDQFDSCLLLTFTILFPGCLFWIFSGHEWASHTVLSRFVECRLVDSQFIADILVTHSQPQFSLGGFWGAEPQF